MTPRRSPLWLRIEYTLAAAGIFLLLYVGFVMARAAAFQRSGQHALTTQIAEREDVEPNEEVKPHEELTLERPTPPAVAPGDVIGSLEIPRLQLKVVVTEGDGESSFTVGLGHLPDTPLPWQTAGNVAVAGHRDTFLRPLRNVTVGDLIQLRTRWGQFDYQVAETMIVMPEDVWVLKPTGEPTLTLITCYPFAFIGHAPQRFIVRAAQRAELQDARLSERPVNRAEVRGE